MTTKYGRPDIELRTAHQLVYLEVKDKSDHDSEQLRRYRMALNASAYPQTALVFISRNPVEASEREDVDAYVRWMEISDVLESELESTAIKQPEAVFLTQQFISYLKARQFAMSHIDDDLGVSLSTAFHIVNMLYEASSACNLRPVVSIQRGTSKSASDDWIGVSLDGTQFYLGIYGENPSLLVFDTYKHKIDRMKALDNTLGEFFRSQWPRHTGEFRWRNVKDLVGDRFFELDKTSQYESLRNFISDSHAYAMSIGAIELE